MALNINWRFAGPQNINVPQSNFLNSLDKNIQNALGIKKEFDKKRDDNEMIRLMTEEAENKLTNLINEKDELTTQYNLLTADEQLAQKTYYENKLKELDIQIESARKEVTDAKMNANQFKTTGTTDFFRWKKDKEYASDVAAVNRDILNEQNKQEKLSNLEYDIKSKQAEFDRSNDKDEQRRLTDEINHLKEQYNKISGENVYEIKVPPKNNVPSKNNVPPNADDIKGVDYLKNEISKLTWQENLANSDAVKQIQDEIDKYNASKDKDALNQALENKIVELNKAEAEKEDKAKKGAIDAKNAAKKKLDDLIVNQNLNEISKFYYDTENKNYKDLLDNAYNYLLNFLRGKKLGAASRGIDRHKALLAIYGPNGSNSIPALATFIERNVNAINGVKQVKN